MTDKEKFWFITVEHSNYTFIVKANTKGEAINKAYNQLNESFPPKYLRERGYRPYYKKDIDCEELDKLLGKDGIYWF